MAHILKTSASRYTQMLLCIVIVLSTTRCKQPKPIVDQNSILRACPIIEPSAVFVILTDKGENLLAINSDTLILTTHSNGVEKRISTNTFKLRQPGPTVAFATVYGGIGLNSLLSHYSCQDTNPIDTFGLYVNNQLRGLIYYHQRRVSFDAGCFTNAIVSYNGSAIPLDTTVVPFANIIRLK